MTPDVIDRPEINLNGKENFGYPTESRIDRSIDLFSPRFAPKGEINHGSIQNSFHINLHIVCIVFDVYS